MRGLKNSLWKGTDKDDMDGHRDNQTESAQWGDSCRNGNTCDAGTLKNHNCNVHNFGDIRKKYCDKMFWFWDETMSQLKS